MVEVSDNHLLENFHKDRNVILKASQEKSFDALTRFLINLSIRQYRVLFNPLGLIDDTFKKIIDYRYENIEVLKGIYENLSVAYRYKNSDNQLEIIWDGRTHETVYTENWSVAFKDWIDDLTQNPYFTKGIIQMTVFADENKNDIFIANSLKGMINQYFEIKILKRNGIKRVYKARSKRLKKAS